MIQLRKYERPKVTMVELRVEEAVLGNCKSGWIPYVVAQYAPDLCGGCYFGALACKDNGS